MSQGKTLTAVVKAENDKVKAAEAKADAVASKEELPAGHALVRLVRPLYLGDGGTLRAGLHILPIFQVPKSAKWVKPAERPKAAEAKD